MRFTPAEPPETPAAQSPISMGWVATCFQRSDQQAPTQENQPIELQDLTLYNSKSVRVLLESPAHGNHRTIHNVTKT